MVFLCWKRPSPLDQKKCIDKCENGSFNYDSKYRNSSSKPLSSLQNDQQLTKDGFFINHSRTLVGTGLNTYEKSKTALQNWKHFGLNWTFVDPNTSIETGNKFCVCADQFVSWIMMPLQVAYVNETKFDSKKLKASFGFGSGTLQGHLLSGEERFSIELDENNQVWYEILSFSKPAHFLSFVGYPYVQLQQKTFAQQSAGALVKHVTAQPNL
ncbi:hypothetical protein AQUCO_04300077v1 [Aquilegia coerulea]|uniref:DUF1990 domain-containing protein n=1 Tax=Aquilegia coerulea TaxID=218851 RepID=A0A2G5CNJ9_AQUCA|nr:hypothetical protein AQUCO_04300077v1 [Aquilegia coerulea]